MFTHFCQHKQIAAQNHKLYFRQIYFSLYIDIYLNIYIYIHINTYISLTQVIHEKFSGFCSHAPQPCSPPVPRGVPSTSGRSYSILEQPERRLLLPEKLFCITDCFWPIPKKSTSQSATQNIGRFSQQAPQPFSALAFTV